MWSNKTSTASRRLICNAASFSCGYPLIKGTFVTMCVASNPKLDTSGRGLRGGGGGRKGRKGTVGYFGKAHPYRTVGIILQQFLCIGALKAMRHFCHHFTKIHLRYSTRQSLGDLCVPRPNIELIKQCLLYQGAKTLRNSLRNDLKM